MQATRPGQFVSVDQLESSALGFITQLKGILTKRRYTCAMVFVDHFSDVSYIHHHSGIQAYPASEVGRIAAFMKDNDGRTPFNTLCERGADEILFLTNKSFGGLIMWWNYYLGIDFVVEDVN